MSWLAVLLIVFVVLIVAAVMLYNALVRGRLGVKEAWSAIEVQLQRRASLIPNLVETVKGYASHERETFDSVTKARAGVQAARTATQAAEANAALTRALVSLFAVAENYPDLKANQNFIDLQAQLKDSEDKIAYARNYYNARVLSYNNTVSTIPGVLVAGPLGFGTEAFFDAPAEAEQEVVVSFDKPAAG